MNLPDGKATTSQARYIREWRKRTKYLKSIGLKTIGFDPGFLVSDATKKYPNSFDLPTWFVNQLMESSNEPTR